ncbi:MAG TPA: hypothetical protein VIV60_07935, partial [Polyangiaceae bacterium]
SRRDTIWIVGAKYYKGKNPLTPDEWDDCLLLHEYAHQVANKGGFSWTPSSGDTCATHTFGRPAECPIGTPSPGYAWNEGWADFLGALLGDVGTGSLYIDYGYNGQDSLYLLQLELESGERYEGLPFSPPRANLGHAGPSYEAANAGALWDWVDSSNDDEDPTACADHFTDGFDRMLNRLLTDQALGLDSLANVYMVYQHHELAGDLPRARALFEVLCDHGWWRAGADSDTVEVVSVASGNLSSPRLMLAPTPSQGRVVFSVAATPSEQPPVIEVFDIAGRVIWRAMTRRIDDGLWRVVWDTRTNAGETARSGVYFARCRVSGTCLRHTLVVMR